MAVLQRYEEWLGFTEHQLGLTTGSFPWRATQDFLVRTFDTQVSWNWEDPDGSCGVELSHPIAGFPSAEYFAMWTDWGRHAHPLLGWFVLTGDPRPMSLGRVPDRLTTERGIALLRGWMAPLGVEQQLSIPYELGPGGHRAFVLVQPGAADYSCADLDLARRIQPLLALLARVCAAMQVYDEPPRQLGLTPREVMVLQKLAEGGTAHAIAHQLGVSPRTVHTHLTRVYRKLGVRDRMQAVLVAQELGLLGPCRAHPPEGHWGQVTS
jgi:DNA-binding CsgD family transcriptional regulator